MLRLLMIRVASALATLIIVSVLVFTAIHLIPGDYEDIVLGPIQTEEAKAQLRARYSLDDPLPLQYVSWLRAVASGDLGLSMVTSQSVGGELLRRAAPTVQLTTMAAAVALIVGVPLGFAAGLTNRWPVLRGGSRLIGAAGLSVPDFVLGSLLVYMFTRWSLGLKVGGYVPFMDDPGLNLRVMLLPALTLGVFGIALIMRTMRDAVLSAVAEPFTTAAVARGEAPGSIVRHHLLRNTATPLLTVTTPFVGYLLGGAVIVETLFSIPGVGVYLVNSIHNRDYAVLQGGVLVASALFITLNMMADLLYAVIDPRMAARRPLA